jgi:hypothetical protein
MKLQHRQYSPAGKPVRIVRGHDPELVPSTCGFIAYFYKIHIMLSSYDDDDDDDDVDINRA